MPAKTQPHHLPPKCGQCDETRHIQVDAATVRRCPDCHPIALARAARALANRAAQAHCLTCGQVVHRTHQCRATIANRGAA